MTIVQKPPHTKTPTTNSRKRLTIEEMQQIAIARGGLCLSDTYFDNLTPLLWQCAKQHRWHASPDSVKNRGAWCRFCFYDRRRGNLEQMRELAQQHGGQVLSNVYVDHITNLLWRCAQGHIWQTKPATVKAGSWCPECSLVIRTEKLRLIRKKKKKGHSFPYLL